MPESRNGRIIYSPEEQFTNSVERLKEIQTKYRKGRAILAEALAIKGGEQHSQEETAEMIRRVRQQTETENANIASAHDYAVKQYQRKHGIPPVTIDQPGYLDDYQEALLGHSNGWKEFTTNLRFLIETDLKVLATAYEGILDKGQREELNETRQIYKEVEVAFAGIPNLEDTEALKAYLAPGGNPVLPHLPLSPYIDKVVQANNFIHSPTVDLYRVKRILDCDVHAPLYDVRYRKPLLEFGERLEAVAANLLTMQVVTVEPKEVAQDLLH